MASTFRAACSVDVRGKLVPSDSRTSAQDSHHDDTRLIHSNDDPSELTALPHRSPIKQSGMQPPVTDCYGQGKSLWA